MPDSPTRWDSPYSLQWNTNSAQSLARWHMPIITALWEADAGRLQVKVQAKQLNSSTSVGQNLKCLKVGDITQGKGPGFSPQYHKNKVLTYFFSISGDFHKPLYNTHILGNISRLSCNPLQQSEYCNKATYKVVGFPVHVKIISILSIKCARTLCGL